MGTGEFGVVCAIGLMICAGPDKKPRGLCHGSWSYSNTMLVWWTGYKTPGKGTYFEVFHAHVSVAEFEKQSTSRWDESPWRERTIGAHAGLCRTLTVRSLWASLFNTVAILYPFPEVNLIHRRCRLGSHESSLLSKIEPYLSEISSVSSSH